MKARVETNQGVLSGLLQQLGVCVCVCVCVYLSSCIVQGLSRVHSVLSSTFMSLFIQISLYPSLCASLLALAVISSTATCDLILTLSGLVFPSLYLLTLCVSSTSFSKFCVSSCTFYITFFTNTLSSLSLPYLLGFFFTCIP